MITGEQLSAYLAGELDADERRRIEAALERDPEVRARLERLRALERTLAALPEVQPRTGFSQRLHAAVDGELEGAAPPDELTQRRSWVPSLRPVGVAAAAAALIAVFGLGGLLLLRGGDVGSGDGPGVAMDAGGAADVPIVETDNDYDAQELQRLTVNVDFGRLVPPGLGPEEAAPLASEYNAELELYAATRADDAAEAPAETSADGSTDGSAGAAAEAQGEASGALRTATGDAREAVGRCLATVLAGTDAPLVPVYVELARFEGQPAIIYTLVTEDPESGTYRRVEAWAVSRDDCRVLNFAQYDRE